MPKALKIEDVDQNARGAGEAVVKLFEELVALRVTPAVEASAILEEFIETLPDELAEQARETLPHAQLRAARAGLS